MSLFLVLNAFVVHKYTFLCNTIGNLALTIFSVSTYWVTSLLFQNPILMPSSPHLHSDTTAWLLSLSSQHRCKPHSLFEFWHAVQGLANTLLLKSGFNTSHHLPLPPHTEPLLPSFHSCCDIPLQTNIPFLCWEHHNPTTKYPTASHANDLKTFFGFSCHARLPFSHWPSQRSTSDFSWVLKSHSRYFECSPIFLRYIDL